MYNEEQHITQKRMAKKRYPAPPEKELELDLCLTSLRLSRLFSWLYEVVEITSASSRLFDLPAITSNELSLFVKEASSLSW